MYANSFYSFLKREKVDVIFFGSVPHEGPNYLVYIIAKILDIKTIIMLQSIFPNKFHYCYDINDFGEFNNPWNFISDIEYKKILEKNGFEVESIELINRPTKIEDIKVWLDIFANGITKDLTTKQKEIFKEEVEKILKNKIYSEEFGWLADYVRLRVVANKL